MQLFKRDDTETDSERWVVSSCFEFASGDVNKGENMSMRVFHKIFHFHLSEKFM